MDLKTALENVKVVAKKFALQEIMCIREHKEEAIPVLLDYVKEVAKNEENLPEDYNAHLYAMFLLAEFKVHQSFEFLIKYLEFDYEITDWILCDILTEDFGAILGSVATINDVERIKEVIQNSDLDDFNRSAALTALIVMYVDGIYPQKDLFEYIGFLLKNYKNKIEFNTLVVCDCIDVYCEEHFEYIKKLFKDDLIDEDMMDIDDFYRDTAGGSIENALYALKNDRNYSPVVDTVKSMSWWNCFKNHPESNKTGRNDPCPCGSGKKYKKCCGGS